MNQMGMLKPINLKCLKRLTSNQNSRISSILTLLFLAFILFFFFASVIFSVLLISCTMCQVMLKYEFCSLSEETFYNIHKNYKKFKLFKTTPNHRIFTKSLFSKHYSISQYPIDQKYIKQRMCMVTHSNSRDHPK